MFKITPSLYSTFAFWSSSDNDDDQELLDVLNRVKRPKTQDMIKGIEFENEIRNACSTLQLTGYNAIDEIAYACKGGEWQVPLSRKLSCDVEVHGIADVIIPNHKIYDIKRVRNSSSYTLGKYMYSIQHLVYMFCSDIHDFEYLISDGTEVYREYYNFNNNALDTLKQRVNSMIDTLLSIPKFRTPFVKNWKQ